jgi:hypothetical protein
MAIPEIVRKVSKNPNISRVLWSGNRCALKGIRPQNLALAEKMIFCSGQKLG